MTEQTVLIGESRFLQLADESAWGLSPGSPTWFDVPVTDYNVRFKPKRKNGQARTGTYQRRYGTNQNGSTSGNLVIPMYGFHPNTMTTSLAQYLMEWGFLDQEAKYPRSKCAQWEYVDHSDDKGHTGLRVNQATLAGSDAGIVLTLELMGNAETNFTGTATPPTTRNKLVEFLFEDTTFTLGGTPLNISAFQWSVQRTLTPLFLNSHAPVSIPKTTWTETFSCTPAKADATYDALRNSLGMNEMAATLVLKGLHNGTGTALTNWTQLSVAFARLSLIDSDEQGGTAVQMNPLTFDVLKPDTAANGSVMTWTDIA